MTTKLKKKIFWVFLMPPVTGFRSVASSNIGTFNTENYFKLLLNIECESEMKDYLCSLSGVYRVRSVM